MSVNSFNRARSTAADLFQVSPSTPGHRAAHSPPIGHVKLAEKLNAALRTVGYREDLEYSELENGDPVSFLRLLQLVLVDLQPEFYQFILSKGHELYAKKDLAFVQTVFKMLMREFGMRPPLQVEQFFNAGFFEPKVELVLSCVDLVKKHTHKPKKSTASTKHFAASKKHEDELTMTQDDGPLRSKPISIPNDDRELQEVSFRGRHPRPIEPDDDEEMARGALGFQRGGMGESPEEEDERPLQYGEQVGRSEAFGWREEKHMETGRLGFGSKKESPGKEAVGHHKNLTKTASMGTPTQGPGNLSQNTGNPSLTADPRDALIAAQRKTIDELKALVLLNCEAVKGLSSRLATHTAESAKKIEALEARVKLLEAVGVIRGGTIRAALDNDSQDHDQDDAHDEPEGWGQ